MGIADQLRVIDDGFRLVSSYPELKGKPIIIGESDPEGCAACQGPTLAYRNGTMYSSYTASSFARAHDLAEKYGVNLEGALTWAFEFEDQAYFAGFRSLASNGLDKPVLNVFRMFSRMSGQRLTVHSSAFKPLEEILRQGVRDQPEVSALASGDRHRLWVLVWHYHDDDIPGPQAAVELSVQGLPFARVRRRLSITGSTETTATASAPGSGWAHRRARPRTNMPRSRRPANWRRWGRRKRSTWRTEACGCGSCFLVRRFLCSHSSGGSRPIECRRPNG